MKNPLKKLFSGSLPEEDNSKNTEAVTPTTFVGEEDIRSSLPVQTVSYFFCAKDELRLKYAQLFANELKVPIGIVRKDLNRVFTDVRSDLSCCIEYPYVDEYYRDTYYNYYSRKHHDYNRYCFRVSFFSGNVSEANYLSLREDDITYYGYIVLRPTVRSIIGYTFFSPKIYENNSFSICLCERLTSVMGRRQGTTAFPFCGQDGEITLCAETSIVMIFDYFSRRYNRYHRILPSEITAQLVDNLPDRVQPSRGLDAEMVTSILCALGLNIRRFECTENDSEVDGYFVFKPEDFKRLLYIYIESGFPIYTVTTTHAFLVIGREDKLFSQSPRLVTINDQEYPYKLLNSQEVNDIKSFLVPLPVNVLLDANKIDPKRIYNIFSQECNGMQILSAEDTYYDRIFLTTSRSYKQYVVSSDIAETSKRKIVSIAMPRFIWVCESILTSDLRDDLSQIHVKSCMVLDATNYPEGSTHLLLIKSQHHIIIPEEGNEGKTEKRWDIISAEESMHPFNANLKGNHTQWKG